MLDANDPRRMQLDSLVVELLPVAGTNRARAIGAEDDPRAPRFQRQREARTGGPSADDGDDLVAMLPSVAVRTVVNSHSVALLQTRDLGDVIANAGGNECHARADRLMIVERRFKEVAALRQAGDCRVPWFDAVRAQFLAAQAEQLQGWDTVAAEEPVQCRRACVARLSSIAEQDTPAAAREHECGAETSWTAPDNDDVEHATAELQASGHRRRGEAARAS